MSTMEVSTISPPYARASREVFRRSKAEQPAASLSAENVPINPKENEPVTPIESSETVSPSKSSLLSEFERLFTNFDYETVREEILERRLIDCHFFTVLWRIFLQCLPRDSSQWDEQLRITRDEYTELRRKYSIDPHSISPENGISAIVDHPLSQHPNSVWRQYHDDTDFKKCIEVDVVRTYPNVGFFRNERTINLQTEILFTHSRHNATACEYRQGMHEILGMIVYMQHVESLRVYADPESSEQMKNLYDPQFLEHDSYGIFEKIMVHLRQYYTQGGSVRPPLQRSPSMKDTKRLFEKKPPPCVEMNENVLRMKALFDQLQVHEPSLYEKLTDVEIEPTVYGIRWLRLMFSREIPFESIPILWNVIFCFDESFTFLDHIFIALLKQFRPLILKVPNGTGIDCLHILMKPNVIANAEPVIREALQLAGRTIQLSTESALAQSIPPTPEVVENSKGNIPQNSTHSPKIQIIHVPPSNNPRIWHAQLVANSKKTASSNQSTAETQINGEKKTEDNQPLSSVGASLEDQLDPTSTLDRERWFGKIAREKYDENVQLQETCSQYMGKFVRRLETLITDLNLPNERELLITVSGLKQITYVLSGDLEIDQVKLPEILSEQSRPVKTQSKSDEQPH